MVFPIGRFLSEDMKKRPLSPGVRSLEIDSLKDISGHVLIVDDDLSVRLIFDRILSKLKFGVTWSFAENGKQAVDIFKESRDAITIILMDINMPIMNGLEAAKQIRLLEGTHSQSKPVPIICISTDAEKLKAEWMSAGMNSQHPKPLGPHKITMLFHSLFGAIESPMLSRHLTKKARSEIIFQNRGE